MTHKTNADRIARAKTLIDARNGIGDPQLISSVEQRDLIVDRIFYIARDRRFAVKVQQKIDRALESFVRQRMTGWTSDASEAERNKYNREVKQLIAAAREGEGKERLAFLVKNADVSRRVWDEMRDGTEAELEKMAGELHVASWIKSVPGAGLKGLAYILGETGPLDNYPNPEKLWKRLGFAPYDGYAGSTWKRQTWRPRQLTKDEWIANPFSGERYAQMYQIALWLWAKQWISKKKTGGTRGRPNGRYGELYAARRSHTDVSHPEWTDGHRHSDALRVMFKQYLVDLWEVWVDRSYDLGHGKGDAQASLAEIAAAGQGARDAQPTHARGGTNSNDLGHSSRDAQPSIAEIAAAGQPGCDAHQVHARGGTKSKKRGQVDPDAHPPGAASAAGHMTSDAPSCAAGGIKSKRNGQLGADAQRRRAVPTAAGHASGDAQGKSARGALSR